MCTTGADELALRSTSGVITSYSNLVSKVMTANVMGGKSKGSLSGNNGHLHAHVRTHMCTYILTY